MATAYKMDETGQDLAPEQSQAKILDAARTIIGRLSALATEQARRKLPSSCYRTRGQLSSTWIISR